VNNIYGPGQINFDMAVQKDFALAKDGKVRLQFRIDAFNVFNHANYSGYNSTLNFNSYTTTAGRVTGLPTITATALGRNANGSFNPTGFGTATQPNPGALGYARILQTLVRVTF